MKLWKRSRIPATIGLTLALLAGGLIAGPTAAQAEEFVPTNQPCDTTGFTGFGPTTPLRNGGAGAQNVFVSLNTCDARSYAQFLIRKALEFETPKQTIGWGATVATFLLGIGGLFPLAAGTATVGFGGTVSIGDAQTKLRILSNLVDDYNNNQCGKRGIQFKVFIKMNAVAWSDMRCQPGPSASVDDPIVFDPTADYPATGSPEVAFEMVAAPQLDSGDVCAGGVQYTSFSDEYGIEFAYAKITKIGSTATEWTWWNPDTGLYDRPTEGTDCTPPPPVDPPCPTAAGAFSTPLDGATCTLPPDKQMWLHLTELVRTPGTIYGSQSVSLPLGASISVKTWYSNCAIYRAADPYGHPQSYCPHSEIGFIEGAHLMVNGVQSFAIYGQRWEGAGHPINNLYQGTWWVSDSQY